MIRNALCILTLFVTLIQAGNVLAFASLPSRPLIVRVSALKSIQCPQWDLVRPGHDITTDGKEGIFCKLQQRRLVTPIMSASIVKVNPKFSLDGHNLLGRIIPANELICPCSMSKIVTNVPADSSLNFPPGTIGEGEFCEKGATSSTIPFDLRTNKIVIQACINGQPVSLVFDSCAAGLAVSEDTAKLLHLNATDKGEVSGVGGTLSTHLTQVDMFEIPNAIRVRNLVCNVLPLPGSISGVIGYDLLSRFVVHVHFVERTITFISPGSFHPTDVDGKPIKLHLLQGVPTVDGCIDDSIPGMFLIDTGNYFPILLSATFIKQYDLLKRYPVGIPLRGGGIAGAIDLRCVTLNSFRLGCMVETQTKAVLNMSKDDSALPAVSGNIGVGFLSGYDFTFDYPNSMFYLSRE